MADDKDNGFALAFARFEGVVATKLENLAHDVKGITATLVAHAELFMPRREAEKRLDRYETRLAEVEAEQGSTRERHNKILFWAVTTGTVAGGVLSFLGRKLGWTG